LWPDTASGTEGGSFAGLEPVTGGGVDGVTIGEGARGHAQQPSGTSPRRPLFVTDTATSRLSIRRQPIRQLDTGFAPGRRRLCLPDGRSISSTG
jgi:hypothetical protein